MFQFLTEYFISPSEHVGLLLQSEASLRPVLALHVEVIELLEVPHEHLLPPVLAVEVQEVYDTRHLVILTLLLANAPVLQ